MVNPHEQSRWEKKHNDIFFRYIGCVSTFLHINIIHHFIISLGLVHVDKSRPLEYERVYLSLFKVAETPFHIQEDKIKTGG